MLDSTVLCVRVEGEFACFTRPDLKVERMTYPCMTPSAARGVLDSILWKPEFQWYVRRIKILKPVKFASIKRNEISKKQKIEPIEIDEIDSRGKPVNRTQRNSIILKEVSYVIEASIFQRTQDINNPPKKYAEMFKRRVRKGQCWRRPYLGTREFSLEFYETDGTEKSISDTIPIGSMLFDIFYNDNGKPEPVFFYDVAIKGGVLDCTVPENDKLMLSSHFRPPVDSEVSAVIYEFNRNEESEEAV